MIPQKKQTRLNGRLCSLRCCLSGRRAGYSGRLQQRQGAGAIVNTGYRRCCTNGNGIKDVREVFPVDVNGREVAWYTGELWTLHVLSECSDSQSLLEDSATLCSLGGVPEKHNTSSNSTAHCLLKTGAAGIVPPLAFLTHTSIGNCLAGTGGGGGGGGD